MLEESNKIDFIIATDDGTPRLVISDSGLTTDPHERLEALREKGRFYWAHLNSAEFQKQYPGWRDGAVVLTSPNKPTEEMAVLMVGLRVCDVETGEEHNIPILFEKLPALF